ncbi:MAG: LPP20 family lipoprotein, partial [Candidatus Marinimicrobia bacterium]|nr:LPP20 family lipoprotein [Candidatus Neomarinimicrobiota bacterium]
MKKQTTILIITILFSVMINAQSSKQIKKSDNYIWGVGEGRTIRQADKRAIDDLISQISVRVESKFTSIATEKNENVEDYSKLVLNTYSNTTLNSAKRKVEENDGEYTVIRYIRKVELSKIFENRKNKIFNYIKYAMDAEKELRIADALKYYYWSLILLRSHPDNNEIEYNFDGREKNLLITALPERIDNIFSNLDITKEDIKKESSEKKKDIILKITYKNKLVQNLDYEYWLGDSWSMLTGAKDGIGVASFYGKGKYNISKLKLKVEYMYENESHFDNELQELLEKLYNIPQFSEATFILSLKEKLVERLFDNKKKYKFIDLKKENEKTAEVIFEVIDGIKEKNFDKISKNFTKSGKKKFDKIIKYGNAKLLNKDTELKIIGHDSTKIVRELPMSFDFPNNNKKFVEDVVFTLDKDDKIESVSFSLSDTSIKDILKINKGTNAEKYQIVQFMENYKTAYCLERIDYIESIFAENALIIVGSIVKEKGNIEGMYNTLGREKVRYNRLSKKEYIQNLRTVFNSNEYVNIHFEDNIVKTTSDDKKIFGIQIKQNYYSANYSDQGYLFLMVDMSDTTNPKIFVRTWQPVKDTEKG